MEKILVSIITPMYNCEKYISRCIESILNQTYTDIELILVDDGSKDNTLKIVEAYKDERIKVYKKKNGGASSARNYGITRSSGKYILFVDADDYVDVDIVKSMVKKINGEKNTMVFANNYEIYSDAKYERKLFENILEKESIDKKTVMREIASGRAGLVCCKLIPKNIINKFNIKFNENIKISEDQLFFLELSQHIDEFKMVERKLYYYDRTSENSTTVKYNDEIYNSQMKVFNLIKEIFIKNNMKDKEDIRALSMKQKDIMFSCISNELEGCNIKNIKSRLNNIKEIISKFKIDEELKEYICDSTMGQLIYKCTESDKYTISVFKVFIAFKILLPLKNMINKIGRSYE